MSEPPPDTSPALPSNRRATWRKYLLSASPFVFTVVVSVALTLLVQAALPPSRSVPATQQAPSAGEQPAQTAAAATPLPTQRAARPPAPSPAPPVAGSPASAGSGTASAEGSERTDLASLQREVNRLWSAYYLARAANQVADAEAALRVNDLHEVEQMLITVDASLARAYERSAEQEKGPINEFRIQVGQIHENLRVRPEGMDQQLRRLRQSMLSLVDEGN